MERLDAVCGPEGWQCRYPHANSKTCCEIGILTEHGWIWRSDGAGDTDFEGAKGAFSDAFKRAAVRFGIGRYLYDLPSEWVEIESRGRSYVIKQSALDKLHKRIAPTGGNRLHGPLGITELKKKMMAFAQDLAAVQEQGDEDQLTALLNSSKDILDQCQRDLPAWWFGDGKDAKGAMQRIEETRKHLQQAESQYA